MNTPVVDIKAEPIKGSELPETPEVNDTDEVIIVKKLPDNSTKTYRMSRSNLLRGNISASDCNVGDIIQVQLVDGHKAFVNVPFDDLRSDGINERMQNFMNFMTGTGDVDANMLPNIDTNNLYFDIN